MATIDGLDALLARLREADGEQSARYLSSVLYAIGDEMRVEAQISITAGSVSGKHHEPSRPGQPPHNDTGLLANNIEVRQIDPFTVEVASRAPYSRPLEFGTSKIAERPFMRPAFAKVEPSMRKTWAAAMSTVMGGARTAAEARAYSKQEGRHFGGTEDMG